MQNWFEDKEFMSDFVTAHLSAWTSATRHLFGLPVQVLEIGSSEGRSAVAFLNLLPNSSLTCIDVWEGDIGAERQERFDRNLAPLSARVEKIVGNSRNILPRLAAEGRTFGVIYVDGDHSRDAVMSDLVHGWHLLERGGVMIIDDYLWGRELPSEERPQQAIDRFLEANASSLKLIRKSYQVIVEKISDVDVASPAGTGAQDQLKTPARTPANLYRFLSGQPMKGRSS